jgi:hypothetical protein
MIKIIGTLPSLSYTLYMFPWVKGLFNSIYVAVLPISYPCFESFSVRYSTVDLLGYGSQ